MQKATYEMLKKSALAVYDQGEVSANSNGTCLYRGPRGLKCAIGHLIPDESYDISLENKCPVVKSVQKAVQTRPMSSTRAKLLEKLQECHDDCECTTPGGEFRVTFLQNIEASLPELAERMRADGSYPELVNA